MFSPHKRQDKKSNQNEDFDSMFAFTQHDGEIDYEASKTSSSTHSQDNSTKADHQFRDVPGDNSSEYEQYTYPSLILQYENTSAQYWPNLDEQSRAKLLELKEWIQKDSLHVSCLIQNDLHPDLLYLRFLRAHKFDLAKTKVHLAQCIEEFTSKHVASIIAQKPEDILGCSLEELTAVFPHWHSGYDKTGRPVLYKQYGKFDAATVKKLCGGSFDNVVKYHVWEQEACARLCLSQSKKTGTIVETLSIVVDLEDMTLVQITGDFMTLIKLLAAVDSGMYPETTGRIFILNASTSFHVVWAMVKPWIVPATASKIKVLGGPEEYTPVLIDFIGKENLPSNYGGASPQLTAKVHPYAETVST